jgi:Tfp pilus assembly protein PilN
MIKINLLPREIYAEEARRQLKMAAIATGAVVVLLMLGIWSLRFVKLRTLDARLIEANADLRKYQAIVDQVNELEQTRNLLRARRDVIQQLLVGRLIYPKFFEDFMALLPSEIWVGNINTSLDGSGVMTVTVGAQSLSNFAIADWLTNLQSSAFCSEVKLGAISTQEQGEGKAATLSFSMSFKYLKREA